MEKYGNRRQARENAFRAAFALAFQTEEPQEALDAHLENGELELDSFAKQLLQNMIAHREEIDATIEAHLKGWSLSRVPRVSLTALRLALAELQYGEEKKPAVTINETVELVKAYGSDSDYQFVNGLLGAVVREQNDETSC